jgi:hypothetical protein
MLNHTLSTLRRTIALFLILAALLLAIVTSAIMGQLETKSYTIFGGSHQWYPITAHQTNPRSLAMNPLYAGAGTTTATVIMANHNFDAM